MNDNIYKFTLHTANKCFDNEPTLIQSKPLSSFNFELTNLLNFHKEYNKISIPIKVYKLLKLLLEKFNLNTSIDEFTTLICAVQKSYSLYSRNLDNNDQELINMLYKHKTDTDKFLSILKLKLDTQTDASIRFKSISFKTHSKTISIKNIFVINDILTNLIEFYGIDHSNFEKRKNEILQDNSSINYNRGDAMIINICVNKLYSFLKDSHSQSKKLKFIGAILILSQIPLNKESEPLLYEDDLDSLLMNVEIKFLRNYLVRKQNFYS